MYFSPKTSADGLVFHYDTGNTVRSYLGEPTTNLAYAANSYLNSNSNWWINAGNATFNDNDTSIQKPVIPNVDTSNLRIFSSTVTVTGGNQQLGSTIVTVSPSTTYSFSIYYYFTGTTMQAPPYVRTLVNNDLLAYFAYNGDTNYLNWPRNKWILLKATVTTQANENGIYMSSYTGDTLGEKLAYFGYQVEQKSHCTPLVLGTRSATQGLKDLAATTAINLSNVSFDSNAQMVFDGTNDYIDLGNISGGIGGSSQATMELVINMTFPSALQQIFGFRDNSAFDFFFLVFSGGGTEFRVRNSAGTIYDLNPSIASYSGKPVHVVFTVGPNGRRVYFNGTVAATDPTWTGTLGSTAPFNIGRNSGNTWFATGTMPVAKIYNRALTADEVARNFNAIKSRFNIG